MDIIHSAINLCISILNYELVIGSYHVYILQFVVWGLLATLLLRAFYGITR